MSPSDEHAPYHSLTFTGYLDISRYPEFRGAFAQAPPAVPVLVDLTDATGVDSVFLSELLLFKRRRRPLPVAVLIVPSSQVARVFMLANVGEKMDVFTERGAALGLLS